MEIRIPTSEEEAAAMANVGIAWLRQYAPHRLTGDNMRCYKVTVGPTVRYAPTQGEARSTRNDLQLRSGNHGTFEQVEIPTTKQELLEFLNSELLAAEERTTDDINDRNDIPGEDA